MATDHRGTPIHAGKRTNDEMHVSRLARLMSTQNNRNMMTTARGGPVGSAVSPEETQSLLNDYRSNRDNPSSLPENIEHDANFINKSFKGRHSDSMGESGNVDLDKFSSRQELAYDEPRNGRYPDY